MRGTTSKRLRRLAEQKWKEDILNQRMSPPETPAHAFRQIRVLYHGLKRAWKRCSNPKSLAYVKHEGRLNLRSLLINSD